MKKIIAIACVVVLAFVEAKAEGYQVNLQSTKQAGMGHVGVSMKLGAESMHFNPAGLAFMDKTIDLSAGVSGVFSSASFKDDTGYKFDSDNAPSTPLYVYAGFKIFDNLAAGISLTTPYGSGIHWGDDWKGAHLIQDISLKAFNFQPTISWKITDRLSIGAGLMMDFGNISMDRALIGPGEMTYMANYMVQNVAQNYPSLLPILQPMLEPIMKEMALYNDASAASVSLSGKAGVRFGFNVGAMFDINDKLTVGVSYRSLIRARVKQGDISLRYANEAHLMGLLENVNTLLAQAGSMLPDGSGLPKKIELPALNTGTFSSELPLPSNLNFGVTYYPTKRWTVSGEVQFVGWGKYDALDVSFSPSSLSVYNMHADKKYKNSFIYRAGAEFAATNRLDIRFGAYFDQTPVEDEYLNPETPSMNKLGITAGLSFRPLKNLSVDLAFAYVTGFGRDGSYTDEYMLMKTIPNIDDSYKTRVFSGHYSVYALMPSIGISYGF